jgi:transcription elongation factor GreA
MGMADTRPLISRDERERYQQRLAELRRVRDRDLPHLLRAARGFVANDAAEEIAQIQDDLTVVDARIAQLDAILREARVVDDVSSGAGAVLPGCLVSVRYRYSGREVTYVVAAVAQPGDAAVSARSPMGQALLGRTAGEIVDVELPAGRHERIEILHVEAPGERAEAA